MERAPIIFVSVASKGLAVEVFASVDRKEVEKGGRGRKGNKGG